MEELLGRQAPHSAPAEQAILGSMLIDTRCVPDVMEKVRAGEFYIQQNKDMFETVFSMFSYGKTIDPVTVLDEMKIRGDACVYLDITHKGDAFLRRRFPNIFATCKKFGFNMARQPIPVVPAAHYFCGGVATDTRGRTQMTGLHAAGEVAFQWDGTNADGKRMPAGSYTITASHTDSAGAQSKLNTYVQAAVESVTVGSDGLYLNLKGLGTAPLDYVLRVS